MGFPGTKVKTHVRFKAVLGNKLLGQTYVSAPNESRPPGQTYVSAPNMSRPPGHTYVSAPNQTGAVGIHGLEGHIRQGAYTVDGAHTKVCP